METSITYRPLEEWSHDELLTLEGQLWSYWNVDTIDFGGIRTGDPSDGFGAAPNYGDWLEDHLTTIDRILTEAGFRKIPLTQSETYPAPPRGWRRSTQRLRVIGGEALETTVAEEIKHWRSLPEAEQKRLNLATARKWADDTDDPEVFALVERLEAEIREERR